MKALVLHEDKSLSLDEVSMPVPRKNEVLVKIKASALNHREIWISKGLYPGMKLPCILGGDGTGEITAVGEEVDEAMPGDEVIIYPAYDWGDDHEIPLKKFRVLGMPDPGTLAEYIAVPASNVISKPEYLSWEEAAAMPIAYLTAWRGLVFHGGITKSKKVLITGIGGGVAQAALSIAKAIGCETYVTSSSAEKIKRSCELGASAGVNYKDENWNDQLKEVSGGIDLVMDSSPPESLDQYFRFMKHGGKIVAYGSQATRNTTVNISKMFLRHISFIGTAMGSPEDFQDVLNFMCKHNIRPLIDSRYPFKKAIEAIASLEEGKQMGKIVINQF